MIFIHAGITGFLIAGIILAFAGSLIRRYPSARRFFDKKEYTLLERLINIRCIRGIIWILGGGKHGKAYRYYEGFLKRQYMHISPEELLFFKILCFGCAAVLIFSIQYTNISAVKTKIIAQMHSGTEIIMNGKTGSSLRYNLDLYKKVMAELRRQSSIKAGDEERLRFLKRVLPDILGDYNQQRIEERAKDLLIVIKKVEDLELMDLKAYLFIALSFWLPEAYILVRKILYKNAFKNEVVKLENIFEMLGSIKEFKTIHIIGEMVSISKVYKAPLERFRELFRVDREAAIASIREEIKYPLFRKLIDCIKIYTQVDKQLALQIMERNIRQREDESYLTSEEDSDMVEIIAFASIVPVIWQLIELLLKPMVDFIFQSFSGI